MQHLSADPPPPLTSHAEAIDRARVHTPEVRARTEGQALTVEEVAARKARLEASRLAIEMQRAQLEAEKLKLKMQSDMMKKKLEQKVMEMQRRAAGLG